MADIMVWYKEDNKKVNKVNNDFCTNENYLKNSSLDQILCKNSYKKDHFIWLMLDGFAYNEAKEFLYPNDEKIVYYKVNVDFYKQSGMIHDVMLTGSFSRNILGMQIDIDNLVGQIKGANMSLNYVGRKYPMLDLTYSKDKNPYDDIQEDQFEEIFLPFIKNLEDSAKEKDFYKHYNKEELRKYIDEEFEKYDNKDYMFEWLNNLLISKDSQSLNTNLLYYTSYTDYLNHALSIKGPGTFIKTYSINKQLTRLLEWVEKNDYFLFISSDHGGQLFRGEDDFVNHGSSVDENQGIFVLYSKELQGSNIQRVSENMTAYDVSAAVPQFLINTNQPLHSQGFAQLQTLGCPWIDIIGLRQKEIQALLYYQKIVGNQYVGYYESDYYKILSGVDLADCQQVNEIVELDQFLVDYRLYLEKVMDKINAKRKANMNYLLLLSGLLAFGFFFYFLYRLMKMYDFQLFQFKTYTNNIFLLLLLYLDNIFLIFAELGNLQKIHYTYLYITCFFMIILVIFWTNFHKNSRDFCTICCSRIHIIDKLKQCFRRQNLENDYKIYEMQDLSNRETAKEELFQRDEIETTSFSPHQMRNLMILLSVQVLALIFGTFDLYPKFVSLEINSKYFAFVSYPLLFFVINKFCFTINIGDLNTWKKRQFLKYDALIIIMIAYDINHSVQIITQQTYQCFLSLTIYLCLLFIFLQNIISLAICMIKYYYTLEASLKDEIVFWQQQLKLPIVFLLFFVAPEMERIVIIILAFLYMQLFSYQQYSKHSLQIKFFLMLLLLKTADQLYIFFKHSLAFDVSISVGSRTIGRYYDDAPIFTGLLFISNKLEMYGLSAAFMLDFFTLTNFTNIINVTMVKDSMFVIANKFFEQCRPVLFLFYTKLLILLFNFAMNMRLFNDTEYIYLFMWINLVNSMIVVLFIYQFVIGFALVIINCFQKKSDKIILVEE